PVVMERDADVAGDGQLQFLRGEPRGAVAARREIDERAVGARDPVAVVAEGGEERIVGEGRDVLERPPAVAVGPRLPRPHLLVAEAGHAAFAGADAKEVRGTGSGRDGE